MKSLKLTFIGLIALAISSCNFTHEKIKGEGPVIEDVREASAFSSVEIEFSGNVYYSEADEYSIIVQAQSNLIPYIETEVDGGTLVVSTKRNTSISTSEEIKIIITGPSIDEIDIDGSGTFYAETPVTTDELECEINGSGNIIFYDISTKDFSGEINGSGEIQLGGVSDLAEYSINGSGDIKAQGFKSKGVVIEINGSGDVVVHAVKTLEVSISGSGDVSYSGDPTLDIEKSGSGDIHKL